MDPLIGLSVLFGEAVSESLVTLRLKTIGKNVP